MLDPLSDPLAIFAVCLGLFLGGILKGATGAGMPVLAVPIIAAILDVRLAVITLVLPNFLVNAVQIWKYFRHNAEPAFALKFAFAGMIGAGIGTWFLARLPTEQLTIAIVVIIVAYILLRVAKPTLKLPLDVAQSLAWPAGIGGGILQGTVGLSAPIAVTFANAVRLDRPVFIFTVSVFFAAMCLAQIPMLLAYDLMSWKVAMISAMSLPPLFLGVAVGERMGGILDAQTFDRLILGLLALLALVQLYGLVF